MICDDWRDKDWAHQDSLYSNWLTRLAAKEKGKATDTSSLKDSAISERQKPQKADKPALIDISRDVNKTRKSEARVSHGDSRSRTPHREHSEAHGNSRSRSRSRSPRRGRSEKHGDTRREGNPLGIPEHGDSRSGDSRSREQTRECPLDNQSDTGLLSHHGNDSESTPRRHTITNKQPYVYHQYYTDNATPASTSLPQHTSAVNARETYYTDRDATEWENQHTKLVPEPVPAPVPTNDNIMKELQLQNELLYRSLDAANRSRSHSRRSHSRRRSQTKDRSCTRDSSTRSSHRDARSRTQDQDRTYHRESRSHTQHRDSEHRMQDRARTPVQRDPIRRPRDRSPLARTSVGEARDQR
jgi:hypothetical protein